MAARLRAAVFCAVLSLSSIQALAKGPIKNAFDHAHWEKEKNDTFELRPLVNPVLDDIAVFELVNIPKGLVPQSASYRMVNASRIFSKPDMKMKNVPLVKAGNSFQLHIDVSSLNPGDYRLFTKIKASKGKDEYELSCRKRHGHLILDHALFSIDSRLEVPDPGEKGKVGLLGVDSDRDGTRDDIQRWINRTFASSLKQRMALKQYSRYADMNMVNAYGDRNLSIQTYNVFSDAGMCLDYVLGTDATIEARKKLRSLRYNTKERIAASIKASENSDGQGWDMPDKSTWKSYCDFDVDNLAD